MDEAERRRLGLAIGALIGFAPAFTASLSLISAGPTPPWLESIKGISAPMLVAELFTILAAVRERILVRTDILRLPKWCRASILGWLVVAWLGAFLTAPDPEIAVMRMAIWMIHLAFVFAVFRLAESGILSPDRLAPQLLAGFAVYALIVFGFVLRLDDPFRLNWLMDVPGLPYLRHIGYYGAAVIALGIGALACARTRKHWWAVTAAMAVAFALTSWSGTRGAFFAVAAAYAFGLARLPDLRTGRVVGGLALSAIAGSVVSLCLPIYDPSMGLLRMMSATAPAVEDISAGRIEIWIRTLDLIANRPLLGYGDGQLRFLMSDAFFPQPHNAILQFLLAWGTVGSLLVGLPAIIFGWRLFRAPAATALYPYLLGAVSLAAYSMIDGTFYYVQPIGMFALFTGMAAISISQGPEQSDANLPEMRGPHRAPAPTPRP